MRGEGKADIRGRVYEWTAGMPGKVQFLDVGGSYKGGHQTIKNNNVHILNHYVVHSLLMYVSYISIKNNDQERFRVWGKMNLGIFYMPMDVEKWHFLI